MGARIIDGKALANTIKADVAVRAQTLRARVE